MSEGKPKKAAKPKARKPAAGAGKSAVGNTATAKGGAAQDASPKGRKATGEGAKHLAAKKAAPASSAAARNESAAAAQRSKPPSKPAVAARAADARGESSATDRGPAGGKSAGMAERRREARAAWSGNMKLRVLSGIPAAIFVLVLIGVAYTWIVALVVLTCGVYGAYEYMEMVPPAQRRGVGREAALTAAGLIGIGGMLGGLPGLNFVFFLSVVVLTVLAWRTRQNGEAEGISIAGTATYGMLMVPWALGHMALIHGLPGGPGWLAMLVVIISASDTFAYFVGSLLGNRLLLPSVSPSKTVEGSLAGLGGGALAAFVVWMWLLSFPDSPGFWEALLMGVLMAAVGQAGDLLESKLKRLAGVSDSGSLLPGHGGLLDRVDAYLLAAPVMYYILVLTRAAA